MRGLPCLLLVASFHMTTAPETWSDAGLQTLNENYAGEPPYAGPPVVKHSKTVQKKTSSIPGNPESLTDIARNLLKQIFFFSFHGNDETFQKTMSYGNIAYKVFSEMQLKPGETPDDRTDAVVGVITDQLVNVVLNEEETMDGLEFRQSVAFVCLTKGKIRGLRDLELKDTDTIDRPDGSVNLVVTYRIDKLVIYFGKFYVHIPGIPIPEASMQMEFRDNEMVFVLNIPDLSIFLSNALTSSCVARVVNFKVKRLGYPKITLNCPGHVRKTIIQNTVKTVLDNNMNMITDQTEKNVLIVVKDSLATSGTWFCRDKVVDAIIKARGGEDQSGYSPDFYKYCGAK